MNISKERAIGLDFSYSFDFGEYYIWMDAFWHGDVPQLGYEIILYDGGTQTEICILEASRDEKPQYDIDAWLIIQNNTHTVMRNIWKL